MIIQKQRGKERVVWLGITTFLIACLTILLVSPAAMAQSRDKDTEQLLTMFEQVFRFVRDRYVDEVDPQTLIDGALSGMFDSLGDPHSAYLTMEQMRDLTDTTTGEFGGVGIFISKPDPKDLSEEMHPYVEVIAPIEDTPAFRAGIVSGDWITRIEGESTAELTSDEVLKRLRGRPDSDVTITIQRGETLTFDVSLTRAIIEVPTVKWDMLPDQIGYLRILQFTPHTAPKVEEAVRFFKNRNYKSMVIDLRSNPGGLLSSVVDTADLFFSDGVIVSTRSRNPRENAVFAARAGQAVTGDVPIVVLIDKGSASAAEILAGAMKDRERATLIGSTSYGKGSVQQVMNLGGGGFRLTMSRYYTPSGVSIDRIGIVPDKEVKERELSESEEQSLLSLIENRRISRFIEENPKASEAQVDAFIASLRSEGINLEDRLLRRMIRNERNRRDTNPPVYDLQYDIVLQEAVNMLQTGLVAR